MIHAVRSGQGDASLLLHGFTGSGEDMLDLAGRLPGSKILPDLPGHGKSAVAASTDAFEMAATLGSLVDVLDAESVGVVDVVGYSMGGRVALAMAAFHPERTRSVVAIGGRTGIADPDERATRLAADAALADDIERRGARWFAQTWLRQPLYDTQRRLGAGHMADLLDRRAAADPAGLAASLRHLGPAAQPIVDGGLASSGVPVLLLVGELDPKFQGLAAAIEADNPNAEIRVIPDAGHATHVEAPQATAAEIIGFWERVR